MYTNNFKVISQPINETEKMCTYRKVETEKNNGAGARSSMIEYV